MSGYPSQRDSARIASQSSPPKIKKFHQVKLKDRAKIRTQLKQVMEQNKSIFSTLQSLTKTKSHKGGKNKKVERPTALDAIEHMNFNVPVKNIRLTPINAVTLQSP